MTSLNNITSIATAGLYAAQTGMNTVSDNITNVNTTGYVRKVLDQSAATNQGQAQGVTVSGVTLATNRFLENTNYAATADVGQAQIVSNLLGQAQSLLGDPGATTGYFNQFANVLSAFSAAANDPASSLTASDAVNQVSQFLSQSKSVASSVGQLSTQADTNISSDVTQINQLLGQISSLNGSIANASTGGGGATDAQNAQNTLVSQLASLLDVKIASTASGGVTLTTASGQTLVGQLGAASLAYSPSNTAASQVTIAQPGTGGQSASLQLKSGELLGLLNLRNTTLPGVQDQLTEYVNQAVNALNQASNASSTVPAPTTLTGQPVATDITTALTGFSGKTNIAVVNSSGVIQQQVAIDFTAGTITPSGGSAVAFGPSSFIATLNSALGGAATVSTTSANALKITASAGNGVSIADDPTTPSNKSGEGFSQYFGLNNLITTTGVTNYQTGLTTGSTNGFSAGTLTLRLSDGAGNEITDVPVSIPSGGTINDVVNALNANVGGVGLYGQFGLSSTGELNFTPVSAGSVSVSVVNDNTQWGTGGASVSQLFGIGDLGRASRIDNYSVNAAISANPSLLPFAQLNLSAGAGQSALVVGDGSGAQAMANAGSTIQSFDAAGGLGAIQTSVNQYAARLAGLLGSQASTASNAVTNAQAVQTEAQSRQQSVEGVNLDQELVNLTTYQQAYSASSRLITATKDMFTALMSM